MKYKISIFLLATFLLLAGLNSLLNTFYSRYQTLSNHIEESRGYDENTANAIKHAVAASNVFNVLRQVMGDDLAEASVIRLGLMNEYIERLSYYNSKPDTAREIMKDLHNNYVGIMAAKLADSSDTFPVILSFAANRTLMVDEAYNPFFEDKGPEKDVVAFGYDWFKTHHSEIDTRIQKKVMRAKDLRSLAQMELSNLSWKSSTHLE